MPQFEHLQLNGDVLRGNYASIVTGNISVQFDLEEESPERDDFTGLVSESATWLQALTQEALGTLKRQIAEELTEAAYAESDHTPTKEDSDRLEKELSLKEIRFYPDAMYSLVLEARNEYPDMLIWCQVTAGLEIEDLEVTEG